MDDVHDPRGLARVLRRAAKDFHGGLIVTENGVAAVLIDFEADDLIIRR